jgi:multiple sugar transport system permease protein
LKRRGAEAMRKLPRISRVIAVIVLLLLAGFPFYWMFVTSLTSSSQLFASTPQFWPSWGEASVYREAFQKIPVTTWLMNSLIVAAGTTALSLALALYPAYALSRFEFTGKGLAGLSLFATQMLPEAMLVVPLYALFGQIQLLNTLSALILANTAFTIPIVVWILKGAIDGVPGEIEEAAYIDGCTQTGIVWRIVLPLIAPTLAASAVIAFFHGWNEYVFAQTLVSSESLHTASVGLAGFVGELSTPIHTVMSIAVIYTIPAIIFYLFVQKYVVGGMTAGGVKG